MTSASLVLAPAVTHVIRAEAFRAWRSLRRFGFDRSDLQQELTLSCLSGFDRYDPRRSSPATFATRNCRQRTLQLIEPALAAKRNCGDIPQSLSAPVGNEDGATINVGNLISDDQYAMQAGRRSRPAAELAELKIDVDRVISRLPLHLATFATSLGSKSIAEAAVAAGIGRATAYRYRAQVKTAFVEAGLHGYIGQPDPMAPGDAR